MLTFVLQNIIFPVYEADMGALTQLRAGTDPAAAEWNGKVCIV